MKRNILLILILCVIFALGACAGPPTIKTAAGQFEMDQETMATIEDGHGNALAAGQGNTLLVVYFTPAKDNNVTEDEAYAFFYSGTKAAVAGQVYEMKCIVLEKVGGRLRYGAVFEIADNGYTNQNKPDVQLSLPESIPEPTPESTATPIPMPVVTPVPTIDPATSPTTAS